MRNKGVFDLVLIAILSSILFVFEQVLSFLPNIQITFLLIIVYSKVLGLRKTSIIILIHVLLDNLFNSSFNIYTVPFMLIGYLLIPLSLNTVFNKIDNEVHLSFLSVLFSFIYCIIYIIPNCFMLNIDFKTYFISDLYFQFLLMISSFLSVLWLYKPIYKYLNKVNKKDNNI